MPKSPATATRQPWSTASRVAGGGAVAIGAMLVALIAGGGRPTPPPAGIPDAGGVTEWMLPVVQVMAVTGAVATVGLLLAAAVLLPSRKDVLSTGAVRASRLARWTALFWAAASLALSVLVLSDVLAYPLSRTLSPSVLLTYLPAVDLAAAWAATTVMALVVAVAAAESVRPSSAWLALAIGIAAVVPPALAGHASSPGDHDLAMSSLVVHVVAVVVWVGGLLALVWYARTDGRFLPIAAQRFSPLALAAYVAVGASGIANALIRIPEWSDLWSSGYGLLVTVKTAAFVILGGLGWWHRRRTLPELERGERRAFMRFAGFEALVMVAVIGLAVALSRTPTPSDPNVAPPTVASDLLGFPVPPAPTLVNYVTQSRVDVLVALTLLAMGALYAGAVRRLRRRGDAWSWGRTASWFIGVGVLAVSLLSGLSTYGQLLFGVHMTQHMLMSMLAPIFLVLGAPISLALRALPAAGRSRPAGPREWLLAALHSRVVRVLTHPLVALVIYVTAPYMVYFGSLFQYAMFHHWAHLAMHAHFVLVGYLFYESVIGVDPLPSRASYPVRLFALFLSLPFHAFFAVALMSSSQIVGLSYYTDLGNPYGVNLLSDQTIGSAFAWGFGEVPMAVALIALLLQWSRDDDRTARRRDRQADRDGDAELAAYNQMLAKRQGPSARRPAGAAKPHQGRTPGR